MRDSEELILDIADLSRGGAGVARHSDGRVIFVPFTAPGDRIRARVLGKTKNYAHGHMVEIIKQSPIRVDPRCPAFGHCGGCQWQHIPYELQWKTKLSGVKQALSRQSVQDPGVWEEFPAQQVWEYRNRVQLRGNKEKLGFFEAGTTELVAVDRCDLAMTEINAGWVEIRSEGSKLPGAYKVEVEVLPDHSLRKNWNSRHASMGFRQVHDEQNEKLKNWIKTSLSGSETLFDLYGGSGNLSENLSSKFLEIHCVDLSAPTAHPEGFPPHFHFHKMPVLKWVKNVARSGSSKSDLSVIVDPPREGVSKDLDSLEKSLRTLGAAEWILVGCDPDAWSRDLRHLVARGWKLDKAAVIDLFPQTRHVESLALLRL
ncbi:MAG: TRAM domain-containing protein [Bdellovibrionota bacterium]